MQIFKASQLVATVNNNIPNLYKSGISSSGSSKGVDNWSPPSC